MHNIRSGGIIRQAIPPVKYILHHSGSLLMVKWNRGFQGQALGVYYQADYMSTYDPFFFCPSLIYYFLFFLCPFSFFYILFFFFFFFLLWKF